VSFFIDPNGDPNRRPVIIKPEFATPIRNGEKVDIFCKREPFSDFVNVIMPNGYSEELEADEARKWFKDRNANMDQVEKALDYCWSGPGRQAYVRILNYKEPAIPESSHAPKL
jgi:hypothetical protein